MIPCSSDNINKHGKCNNWLSGPAGGATVTAADGTKLWKLGNNGQKHVSVGEFKGTKNVGLREYYEKDGLRPGKKGINLTVEQFNSLVAHAQVRLTSISAVHVQYSTQLRRHTISVLCPFEKPERPLGKAQDLE